MHRDSSFLLRRKQSREKKGNQQEKTELDDVRFQASAFPSSQPEQKKKKKNGNVLTKQKAKKYEEKDEKEEEKKSWT